METRINETKKKEVEEIKRLINEHGIFGIVDMENLPALQLQRLKNNLKETLLIKMSKKRLIKISLDQMKKENFDKVKEKVKGMPALIFTKEDPFKLAKILRKNKSSAPAKAGQTAPDDLYIKAGPTPFAPGPIIGELGQAGIKTEVKEGKVAIKEDKLLVKEGETINAKQADLLSKLKIEPMKIGLNLLLIYNNGEILEKNVLDVDEETYINNFKIGHQEGFRLAIAIGYVTKETVIYMIGKVANEGNALENLDKLKDLLKGVKAEAEEVKEELKIEEIPVEEAKVAGNKEEEKEVPKDAVVVEEKQELIKEEPKVNITEEKKEKVIKEEGKLSAEELIKEAEEAPEDQEEKEIKEKKMMKEVEEFTKKAMWGETGKED